MSMPHLAESRVAPLGLALVEVSNTATTQVAQTRNMPARRTDGLEMLLGAASATRRRVRRGEYLYRYGDAFHALFAIRAGSFKSVLLTEDGREQVTGFHLGGEVLGVDGIGLDVHAGDAVALEDSEVVEIPFVELDALATRDPALQRELFRMLSAEIQRERALMLLLGSMRAEERLAAFLIDLSQRMAARGFSASCFVLRMTREEIGSMLGLKLETVSRILSRFQAEGLIHVRNREIAIVSLQALRAVIGRNDSRREAR
ncbi:MAG: helix-turn-helix domain-containing protein [Burkholderiaceae bacterium]|jgi:CRP/FNR family transcriptional regulator|nr:helix-turn-helix domain-containing protein [Burkholderiaceae bacterium]